MQVKYKEIPKFEDHIRFLKFIKVIQESECWEWQGYINDSGYGIFAINRGDRLRAHRVSYSVFKNTPNIKMIIDHICRNRKCVNPDHLREVTPQINQIENSASKAFFHSIKDSCPKGHKYDPTNKYDGRRCRECGREANKRYALRRKCKSN